MYAVWARCFSDGYPRPPSARSMPVCPPWNFFGDFVGGTSVPDHLIGFSAFKPLQVVLHVWAWTFVCSTGSQPHYLDACEGPFPQHGWGSLLTPAGSLASLLFLRSGSLSHAEYCGSSHTKVPETSLLVLYRAPLRQPHLSPLLETRPSPLADVLNL